MRTNVLGASPEEVLRTTLERTGGECYVVNPTVGTVEGLLSVLADLEPVSVSLLAEEATLRRIADTFTTASAAADRCEAGRLALRAAPDDGDALVVTDEAVVTLVDLDGVAGGLVAGEPALVAAARDRYETRWREATPFDIRTPTITRVRESLTGRLGAEAAADFDEMLGSVASARGGGPVDEVAVALLVAARHGELLYDVSRWGEELGIASKATFSRKKTELEELGLLETERVPIDVGRPRLRLRLAEGRLREATPTEVVDAARAALTGTG
jgi:hypothetical protein